MRPLRKIRKTSYTMSTLHEKLADIQARLKAPKSQYNSFGKYSYRSCEDIMAAVKSLLAEHGVAITVSDNIVEVGGRIYCQARATIHGASGSISTDAYAREEESKKGMDAAQLSGACSSYARKYALSGLLCLDDSKDADSTNNHEEKPAEKAQPKAQAPKKDILQPSSQRGVRAPSEKQIGFLKSLWAKHGISGSIEGMNGMEVSKEIERLKNAPVGETKKEPIAVTQDELPSITVAEDDDVPF